MKRLIAWAYGVSISGPGPCFALWGGFYLGLLCVVAPLAYWIS